MASSFSLEDTPPHYNCEDPDGGRRKKLSTKAADRMYEILNKTQAKVNDIVVTTVVCT
jgi:hypothetical protein